MSAGSSRSQQAGDGSDPEAFLTRASEVVVESQPWGRLEWHVSATIGTSDTMTTGKCVISPGHANGRHRHPNCDEILTVLAGEIIHTWNDTEVQMTAGDVLAIPAGVAHNARNIGGTDAELLIAFSSAYRTTEAIDADTA